MPAGMLQVPFGHAMVSRIAPAMPAHAYKTYGWSMPLKTHWQPATCEQVGCEQYRHGWVSTFDLATDLGKRQYDYCRNDRTRRFTMQRPSLTLVKLVYGPGMRCFRSGDHKMPLGRPARFTVTGGDFRGNPRGTERRVHKNGADWAEDSALHQDTIASAIRKG